MITKEKSISSKSLTTDKLQVKGMIVDEKLRDAANIVRNKREVLEKEFEAFEDRMVSAERLKDLVGYKGDPENWGNSPADKRAMKEAFLSCSEELTEMEEALTTLRKCLRREYCMASADKVTSQIIEKLYCIL